MISSKLNETIERLGQKVAEKNKHISIITLDEQILEVEQEIRMREGVYSKLVARNKMTPGQKHKKINAMQAALCSLKGLKYGVIENE